MDLLEIAINFRKQNYHLGKRYTVPWSGVGGNPPPLKDDLGWAVGLDGWWVWCKGWRVGRR